MDLVWRHLLGPWQDGLILGFETKQEAQELLQSRPRGTFLLRFSDSEVGGVTVAWVADNDQGERQVWNLQPWWAKDFAIRSLADRIHDLLQLQFLYPDIPKNTAFGQYYNPLQVDSNSKNTDYVSTILSVTIPGGSGGGSSVATTESVATPASQSSVDLLKTEANKAAVRDSAEMTQAFFGASLSPQSAGSIQSPEGGSAIGTGDIDSMMDFPVAFSTGSEPTDINEFFQNFQRSS
ncbi:signal transducer and activator of transcription 5B-like [Oscarella lobularis]|uniref:signal transducer and activator of transcription 5B-like n=1 Tax=Oscarella lobularis TaxID=121494 RepID=UPI0033136C71